MGNVTKSVVMTRVGAGNIKAWAEQIVETINEFDGYDSLHIVEILMDNIISEAEKTKNNIMEGYDELEEV